MSDDPIQYMAVQLLSGIPKLIYGMSQYKWVYSFVGCYLDGKWSMKQTIKAISYLPDINNITIAELSASLQAWEDLK